MNRKSIQTMTSHNRTQTFHLAITIACSVVLLCIDAFVIQNSHLGLKKLIDMPIKSTVLLQQDKKSEVHFDESDEDLFVTLMNKKIGQSVPLATEKDKEEESGVCAYEGAGVPRPSLAPGDIVPLIMHALKNNDMPKMNAGLASVWEFATDTTKFIFKNNVTGE